MAQLFLNGWISASPGEGSMRFRLPPDATGATFDFQVRDRLDENIVISGEVKEEVVDLSNGDVQHTGEYTAVISWINEHSHNVPFDYDIAPYGEV